MSPTIRLAINGTIYQLDAATLLKKRPYLKLSEYLREDLHLTGTKVACGEGGCGGCTVLITRRGPDNGSSHLETVSANACLTPMTSLSNCAITTVEGIYTSDEAATTPPTTATTTAEASDLTMYDKLTVPSGNYEPITLANAGPDAALASNVKGRRPHPIQQRFATYNASQCGFCTPGFVMAVCGFLCKQQDYNSSTTTAPSATLQLADIEDAMDGNLCRCTGYRPILEAAAGTAITNLEECHGDRNPDPNCAKCVTCPRAQQCLPDGAHENTLEEARSVLRLVERGFPFMDIHPHSEGTEVPTNAVKTSLVSPSLPRAPHALAARSNTVIASIANGTSTNTIKTIPVIMGSQESTPPLLSSSMTAFSFHQFPRSIEELTSVLISVPKPSLATLVGAQTSAGVYKDHLPTRIMAAAADKSAPSTIISLMHVNELNTVKQWQSTDDACVVEGLTVGAATTISQLIGHLLYQAMWLLTSNASQCADASATIVRAAIILKSIAGTHIRDMATIGGNINMCRNLGFASDLATPLCALGATATVLCVNHADKTSTRRTEPLKMYLSIPTAPHHTDVLVSINIPIVSVSPNTATTTTRTQGFFHRVATRKANSHAILNGACMITTASNDAAGRTITSVSAIFGNTGEMDSNNSNAPKEIPADQIAPLLVGCNLDDRGTVDRFKRGFHVMPGFIEGDYKSAARVQLVKAFIVASLEAAVVDCGSANTAPIKSYSQLYPSSQGHTASSSTTTAFTEPNVVGRPISKPDGILHATGTTTYLTDISPPKSTLYMSIVLSTVPSGVIESFGVDALAPLQRLSNNDSNNTMKASNTNTNGAVELMVATAEEPTTALILPSDAVDQLTFPMFVGAADLPQWALNRHPDLGGHLGEQDRSGAFPGGYYDFPLVANRLVAYRDQPIGVVIGRTLKEAEMGAKAVGAATTYRQVPSASSPLPAHLPQVPSILNGKYGDVSVAAIRNHTIKLSEDDDESIKNIVTNEVDFETVLLGQKHFYMENQACLVIPADGATRTKVHLAVHGVQHAAEFVAKSAGYAINQLEVVQHRMGGSFGGKTNVVHACLATIVSRMLNRPVMVSLDRVTDMLFQGGREEMQVRSKVITTTTTTPNNNNNEFFNQYAALSNNTAAGAPRIVSVQTTTHADVGARIGFSNYTLGVVMPYSIMRCYSPTQSINNTAIGYLTQTCERTNVRSPGHAEAAIITEAIVDRVAAAHNIHSQAVREANFLGTNVALTAPYSKTMYSFPGLYKKMMQEGASTQKQKNGDGWTSRINATIEFNKQEEESGGRYRKGAAVVPFEYPVGGGMYTAMVVVLPDGSVVVHHSGVEMGQGLVVKSLQAANQVLSATLDQLCEGAEKQLSSLPMTLFQSAGNSSHVLPKHGITGGSTSSEGSVDAVAEAAKKIAEMLEPFVCMLFGSEIDIPEEKAEEAHVAKKGDSDDVFSEYTTLAQATGADTSSISALRALRAQLRRGEFESHTLWCRLVSLANSMGAHLTATAMNSEASGSSSYSIYCVGGAEVTVDTYTGDVVVDRVDIMYDAGRSLNPAVDIGQIEGAFIMGLGYMLTEENAHHDTTTGEEVAGGSTWRYKVPSIRELPSQFNVQLMSPGDLEKWLNEENADGRKEAHPTTGDEDNKKVPSCIADKGLVMSSKASGEPPLCIAPCLLSAIRQAVQSSRSSKGLGGFPSISVPYTPDKVLQACGPM